ncbi:MAG: SpoIIE family protein phosphatase [Coriobacteriia bacterium]
MPEGDRRFAPPTAARLLDAVNSILEAALTSADEEELGEACLAVLERVTQSAFGFIGELCEDGTLRDIAISNPGWGACEMHDKPGHCRPLRDFQLTGLYGSVLSGTPMYTNEPASFPFSNGVPAGHPPLTSYLGVPLRRHGKVVGVISLANRPGGYTEEHLQLVEYLAPSVESALHRANSERKLRHANLLLEAHMLNSPLAVIEFDYRFRITRWSGDAERMFGLASGEVLGRTIAELHWMHEEDADPVSAEPVGLADTPRVPTKSVTRNYRMDGSVIWCEWYSSAICDEAGDLASVLSLVLDVTERHRIEEEVDVERERDEFLLQLTDAFRALPDSIFVEERACRMLGEHLGADRVFFAEVDPATKEVRVSPDFVQDGLSSLSGPHSPDCLLELARPAKASAPLVIKDIATEFALLGEIQPRLLEREIGSFVTVPRLDDGVLAGALTVATRAVREWSPREVALVKETADRAWAFVEQTRIEMRLRDSEARFRAVLENSLDAAYRRDLRAERFDYLSPSVQLILGYPPEELMNANDQEMLDSVHAEDAPALVAALRKSTVTGRLVVEYRFKDRDGGYVWLADYASVTMGEDGKPSFRSGVIRDITDHKQAEENLHAAEQREAELLRENLTRTNLLKELATAVASSLEERPLCERVLAVACDLLGADRGDIYLLDEHTHSLRTAAHLGDPQGICPGKAVGIDRTTVSGRAFLSGKSQLSGREPEPTSASAGQRTEKPARGRHRAGSCPVVVHGRTIGVVSLAFPETRPFERGDLDLLGAVADELGVGLENARLYGSQREIAETLQETLVVLPRHIHGVTFSRAYESATYQPGRVGGDFIDVFETHHPWVGITLGDVSGKGIDAAVTTSLVRTTLRVHAIDGLPVTEIVNKTNEVIRRSTESDTFVTLWFGLLNTDTGQLHYVCAGHPPALVMQADGELRELVAGQPLLGAYNGVTYAEQHAELAPGDRILVYSDGVTEARSADGRFLNSEGLHGFVLSSREVPTPELAGEIMRKVAEYSEGVLRDDAAILVVEPTKLQRGEDANSGS